MSALPGGEGIARSVVSAGIEVGLLVDVQARLLADVPVFRAVVDRPTDRPVEVPAEIATARERSERSLPPDRRVG